MQQNLKDVFDIFFDADKSGYIDRKRNGIAHEV
jgi:hypothetical protein